MSAPKDALTAIQAIVDTVKRGDLEKLDVGAAKQMLDAIIAAIGAP